ncbi:MAG TPA: class I SAM-dependent methyltransferase [Thermoanaerobaculia bacterium]|nr:class I SAM-dependent methyltransferase [Thermoanaerobaculia bacterium]
MDAKPPGAPPRDDVAALARDLVDRLNAVAVSASSGLERAAGGAPPPETPGRPVDFGGPRTILENGSRFVSPYLPAEARMRGAKALLLRILRIVTRDQTVFNSAALEALRGAFDVAEAGFRDSARAVAEVREETARRSEEALRAALEAFREALGREASARDALGAEVVSTQGRVGALEKDRDLAAERAERKAEADAEAHAEVTKRLGSAEEGLRQLRLEWTAVRSTLGSARPASGGTPGPAAAAVPAPDDPLRAGLYANFEETFRGSEEEIRVRQQADVARFRGVPGPVVDLGCGRGEFLEALKAAGLEAAGCDANPVMAARAREKGLDVAQADLFEWLAAMRDASLGGVTAYQVVEHLPTARLFDLVELAARKLAPGGRILFETVNPESVYAMKWFWMDLTHVRPVPAPSLAQLLTGCGFRDVTVDWRSPVPAAEALPASAREDPAFAPIARLLFAPQDYAVTGLK